MLLKGRTALITGAASGIGEATARLFAEQGAQVALLGNTSDIKTVADGLPNALSLVADVADAHAVASAFDAVVARWGHLDAVVHAAGVDDPAIKDLVARQSAAGEPVLTLPSIDTDSWRRMMSINLDGSFHVLQSAARVMLPRGEGAVVLVGSEAAVHGLSGLPHYSASKGGVHALVRSAAKELAPFGVRVNGIAPGVIDTPMSRRSGNVFGGTALAPIGRLGQPVEIAKVALFLAGDLSSYVVGEVVNVDGGRTAS